MYNSMYTCYYIDVGRNTGTAGRAGGPEAEWEEKNMKMSFKQWALILKVMEDKVTGLTENLEYYKKGTDADGEDSWMAKQMKLTLEELEPIQEIIKKIQAATL